MRKTVILGIFVVQLILQSCYGGSNASNSEQLGTMEQQYAENPEEFPLWVQPYIRPTAILSQLLLDDSNPLPAREIEQAVRQQLECMLENQTSFEKLVNLVNAQFGLHQANLVINSAVACDRARKKQNVKFYEDIWYCGNEPRVPFGPKWLQLIELQADLYIELAPEYFRLNRRQIVYLQRNIDNQVENLKQFQENPCG